METLARPNTGVVTGKPFNVSQTDDRQRYS